MALAGAKRLTVKLEMEVRLILDTINHSPQIASSMWTFINGT